MMLALYCDFIPRFCPNCGTSIEWPLHSFADGATYVCSPCGLLYAYAKREPFLEAADKSGTDLRQSAGWQR